MRLFRPKMYQKDIFSINYDNLKKIGIKYIIFDLDNTLGKIDELKCNDKTCEFVNELSKEFTIIVASNNKYERVKDFCYNMNVDIISSSLKPSGRVYRYMKTKYTKDMSLICVIGDQIVTDVILGNRFDMMTILVDPIGKKDLKITNFNRFLERKIIKIIKLQRGEYYEKK